MVTFESPRDDVSRFESLYKSHYKDIYAFVYRRSPAFDSDVSEVVSDVFTTAWRRISDVPPTPQDRLWLFGVARICLLEHQRRHQKSRRLSDRLVALSTRTPPSGLAGGPQSTRVQIALGQLRQSDREILILIFWDELSHAETAALLGCSVNAVALRVKKAKARFHDKLTAGLSKSVPCVKNISSQNIRKEHLS
jgi:RNA polymerase sigma-70 factor (ECF subfamily)